MNLRDEGILFIPMFDLPAPFSDEANRWFDFDHVPERLSCKGFIECVRYERAGIRAPGCKPSEYWKKFLNAYAVESPDVIASDAYKLQNLMNEGRGSQWRQDLRLRHEAAGVAVPSGLVRTLWQQRVHLPEGQYGETANAPAVILAVFHDASQTNVDVLSEYLQKEAAPLLLSHAGVLKFETYTAVSPHHATGTARAGLRQFSHMSWIYLATPEIATDPSYDRCHNFVMRSESLGEIATFRAAGVYLERPSPWRGA